MQQNRYGAIINFIRAVPTTLTKLVLLINKVERVEKMYSQFSPQTSMKKKTRIEGGSRPAAYIPLPSPLSEKREAKREIKNSVV
jgi:hypothetical protein